MQSSWHLLVGVWFCNVLGDSNLILDGMWHYWNLIWEVKGAHGLIASPFGALSGILFLQEILDTSEQEELCNHIPGPNVAPASDMSYLT